MPRTSSMLLSMALLLGVGGVAHGDGPWQDPVTLDGLVGSYARAAIGPGDGEIVYVTFGGSDGYRAAGPYTRFIEAARGGVALERGRYQAIGDNPAIGPIINFADERGLSRDNYFILGIERDPLGKEIIALELLKGGGDGQPIVLHRVGW